MDPGAIGALIPVVAIGGFFAWMITLTLSKVYVAQRQAGREAAPRPDPRHDELVAVVEELRREVAELAERVDFTERLLAQHREVDKLGPPR